MKICTVFASVLMCLLYLPVTFAVPIVSTELTNLEDGAIVGDVAKVKVGTKFDMKVSVADSFPNGLQYFELGLWFNRNVFVLENFLFGDFGGVGTSGGGGVQITV